MTTTASLESTAVQLDPGAEAVIPLQIRNNGSVVEGYDITVVGVPGAWATVEPAQVSLYPGTTTTATVTFRPPRSARTPAGEQRFGVVVTPRDNPHDAVVPEGVVEILPFLETTAELVPRTSQGRRGRHQVAVDNRGNVPVNVLVRAHSDGDRLQLRVDPVGLVVPPGEARFTKIRAKSRRAIWRGQPVTHPFVVEVAPEHSTPVELDGSYVQTPVVPKWLMWLLLGLLLLAGALVALWFTLLKPTIESQAKEAAEEAVEEPAAEAKEAAEAAKQNAESANGAATDAERSAEQVSDATGEERRRPARQIVTDEFTRLNARPLQGTTGTAEIAVPEDGVYRVTDVVLSNPQGDVGRAQLLVDGEVQLDVALENFRDLDFHFVSPIVGQEDVRLVVRCRTPGSPPDAPQPSRCDISALLGGEQSVPRPPRE
ncbi:COG1470 family protein [Nocardioides sp. SYSU DS0651]|uniref:COG1470 family protein n=1 Tax=Nocardioides sp. SYSU DS0651 TaxID=3415955 RepID=UPI003F4BEAB4